MAGPLLFRRFPALSQLPHTPLAELPTPLERISVGSRSFWIKRDDLSSRDYGGNKVRKLEFILARAKLRQAERLITAGATGSHHALATALFGGRLGFQVTLVLFPQPVTEHVIQVLLTDAALGAELRLVGRMPAIPAGIAAARIAHWRERVVVVPPGGSDAYGTVGYVNAGVEVDLQLAQAGAEPPDLIVAAAGTLGTVAGLAIAAELLQWPTRVAGVRITSRLVCNERALAALIRATCRLLEQQGVTIDARRAAARVQLIHSQIGTGYGRSTAAADNALRAFAQAGIELDVTYTAKTAAQLLGLDSAARDVLYWHTLSGCMPGIRAADPESLPEPFRKYVLQEPT